MLCAFEPLLREDQFIRTVAIVAILDALRVHCHVQFFLLTLVENLEFNLLH